MKNTLCFMILIVLCFSAAGCYKKNIEVNKPIIKQITESDNDVQKKTVDSYDADKTAWQNDLQISIINKYSKEVPAKWGQDVSGVITHINTNKKIIALTFDACGGKGGNGYDKRLIDYLISEKVPATLFISGKWIDENYDAFILLSKNTLFEIENHGSEHKPLSVCGEKAYGIKGTSNIEEVINEVLLNAKKIEKLTGRAPKYFRSGTAYYDDISVKIIQELGEKAVNFNIIGDAGATYSKDQILKACIKAKPGSIIIFHFNHPEKDTANGIIKAVPALRKMGFEFIKLEDYDNQLQ